MSVGRPLISRNSQPAVALAVDSQGSESAEPEQQPGRYGGGVETDGRENHDSDPRYRGSDHVADKRSSVGAPDHAVIIRPAAVYTVA